MSRFYVAVHNKSEFPDKSQKFNWITKCILEKDGKRSKKCCTAKADLCN